MEIILFVFVFSLVTLGLLAYTKNEPGCEADEQQVENLYLEGRRVISVSELEETRQKLNETNSKF